MKIKIIKAFKNGGVWFSPNQSPEIDEIRAKELIRNGLAVELVDVPVAASAAKAAPVPRNKKAPEAQNKATE